MAIIREYLIRSLWALFAVVYLNSACDCFRLSTMGCLFLCGSLKNIKKSDLTFVVSETCQSGYSHSNICFFSQETSSVLLSVIAPTRTAWPYSKLYQKWTDRCITELSWALTSGKYILYFGNWIKNTLAWVLFLVLWLNKDCVFVSETKEKKGLSNVTFKV